MIWQPAVRRQTSTLRDLAQRNQLISHLELGKRQLTGAWMARIAAVLGCHPWELMAELPPEPPGVFRMLFRLSHAAIAGWFSVA
jgi:hypothetical protein